MLCHVFGQSPGERNEANAPMQALSLSLSLSLCVSLSLSLSTLNFVAKWAHYTLFA